MRLKRALFAALVSLAVAGPAGAMLGGLHGGAAPISGGGADVTSAALGVLGLHVWSSDTIVSGNHITDVAQTLNNTALQYPGDSHDWGSSTLSPPSLFSFGGGVYAEGQKAFWEACGSGHGDGAYCPILKMATDTAKWTLTEQSVRYVSTGNTGGAGNCATIGYPEGNGYRPYQNAAGRCGTGAGHTYAFTTWLPNSNEIFAAPNGTYNSANHISGYGVVNGTNGHWSRIGSTDITAFGGFGIWVPQLGQILVANGANNIWYIDPVTGTKTAGVREDSSGFLIDTQGGNSFEGLGPSGVLIPDPNHLGDTALIGWLQTNAGGLSEGVVYFPQVGTGATTTTNTSVLHSLSPPAALQQGAASGHGSVWFANCATYKAGSTKILIWDWFGGTGLYTLDDSTWAFTGPLASSAMPFGITTAGYKNVFVLSDYVSNGSYIPIGLIGPNNGEYYLYKLAWSDC